MSAGEASDALPPAPAPAKKRKKKRKSAEAGAADTLRAGFPGFARAFPDDPALNELVLAFEQGNYARVREGAQKLLEETKKADKARRAAQASTDAEGADREAVRRAARELLRRVEPDPLAVYMLVGAALLLAFLAFWYWSHPHVPAP